MNVAALPRRGLERWLQFRVDLPLLIALMLAVAVGLITLYSASGGNDRVVMSQAARLGVGFVALWVLSRIPPAQLRLWTPTLFAASLLLLMLVPLVGSGRNARSWLNLGVVYLQPAELLKLTLPMMVAWWLQRRALPPSWLALGGAAVLVAVPTALITIQPDLGTALLVAASGCFVVFLAGIAWWRIALLAGAAAAIAPLAVGLMHEYQRARLRTFLAPDSDPLGAGWNIIQSKIAVGSGGLFGKGWGAGTQSRLDFLPEQTTDFIFAVFAEEFGLIGVLALLSLYLFIVGRALWIAAQSRDSYARLLAGALALTFLIYVLVNGGMVAGLLPVVGVPMPLLSFGGTSAVSLLAGFGIVMSVHVHRRFMGA
ncbi:MAG TPA: rod shape-determining protein RodA [Xanthomonadaceae bacterium]|nr:rod shape-determining protein RodA [Xanthomonadaceae bacterium]